MPQGAVADLTCEPCDFTGWTDTRIGVQRFYDEHGLQPTNQGVITMNAQTARALSDINAERLRQDKKWGVQRHPILPPYLVAAAPDHARAHKVAADAARDLCQGNTPENDNWLDILDEEYREMLAEAWAMDRSKLREELVQTAAVMVNMIETIDESPNDG